MEATRDSGGDSEDYELDDPFFLFELARVTGRFTNSSLDEKGVRHAPTLGQLRTTTTWLFDEHLRAA